MTGNNMAGQADEAPTSADLVDFLMENSDEEPEEQEDDEQAEAPDEENAEEEESPADGDDEADEEDGDDEPEKPKEQTSNRTYKVTVKGEDGADQQVEVPETELIAGYQRHADYTRKTMELGNRERQAVELVSRQLDEGRSYYLQEAQKAHALIQELAGMRSPQEMAYLAQNDPTTWAQEKQRMELVQGAMQRLEQGMTQQQMQAHQRIKWEHDQRAEMARQELSKEGVGRPEIEKVFHVAMQKYKFTPEALSNVTDPNLFRMMRDAAAYQELQSKKPTPPKQKANEVKPRMPAARQSVPSSAKSKSLDRKFASGKASTKDLASFLMQNNL